MQLHLCNIKWNFIYRISSSAQLRVLFEITKSHLHKNVLGAGIIRIAVIIRERALYEEIRYVNSNSGPPR